MALRFGVVLVAALAVSVTALAGNGDWKGVLARGVDLCRVRASESSLGAQASLRVIALPGNVRAVAFGDATDVETTVSCKSEAGQTSEVLPEGCMAWPEDREPVGDVSMCPRCPCTQDTSGGLQSASNAMLFQVGIEPACRNAAAGAPVDVLLFGMGGGAVQTYAMQHCPEHTRVESVEADARMAAIATKFFGVPEKAGVSVVDVETAEEAAASLAERLNAAEAPMSALQEAVPAQKRTALRRSAGGDIALGKKKWDVLVTDCFIDKGVVPEGCRSREFLTYLRLLVRPGGTVLHHMWHTSPYDDSVAPTFDDTVQLYKDTFGEHKVSVELVPRQKDAQWDSVIIVKG